MITDQSLPDNKQCQGGSQRLTCHTCLIVSLEVISFSFIFGTQGLTNKGEVFPWETILAYTEEKIL